MSKLKSIPAFKTEAEERKFWETHDSTDYVDWRKAERVRFPNLKPSTTAISIRLPLGLLEQMRASLAGESDVVPEGVTLRGILAERGLSLTAPLAEVGSTSAAKAAALSEGAPVLLSRMAVTWISGTPYHGIGFRSPITSTFLLETVEY